MLESLFSKMAIPAPIKKVPPVPPLKNMREPLQVTDYGAVPPVPPLKTKVKTKISPKKQNVLEQDIREQIEERAAIMEYDGGLSRKEAEQAATAAIRVYCYRVKDKPNSELVAIMPNTGLDEARETLKNKFGGRLLVVREMRL